MSATLAPFGLRPVFHPTGLDRPVAIQSGIQTGYASNIFKGQIVKIGSQTGFITTASFAAGTDKILGVFAGVEYTDSTGRRRVSNFWPASTAATQIIPYVYTDPQIVYEVQAIGTLGSAGIGTCLGSEVDMDTGTNLTGSTSTGLSAAACDTTLKGAGVQGQLRIIDKGYQVDNDFGDAYTIVRVQIANTQYYGQFTAV